MHLADVRSSGLGPSDQLAISIPSRRPHHLDNDLVVVPDIAVSTRHRQTHRGYARPIPAPVVSRQHPKRAVVPGLRLAQERGPKDKRYLGLGLAQFFGKTTEICALQRK